MKKEIYTELFEYYFISKNDDTRNRRIRKIIRERLKKTFPSRKWEELTEIEKQQFKLVTMKDYLIKFSRNQKETEVKIKEDLEKTLFKANEALAKHNKYIETLFTQYYDASAPEEEQHDSYLLFCENLHQYFPTEVPPTFEEWKAHPLRLYDIQQNLLWNPDPYPQEHGLYESASVTQSQIDHTVLECILIVLERELNCKIDIASIKHCLDMTSNIEDISAVPLQAEIDPSLNMPTAEQQRRIDQNLDLMESIRKLNEHDFIKKMDK